MPHEFWQGTNLPRVGGFNRAVVLDTIRAHGEVSRVELAERTGLTAQTMSNIVRALMADGLVAENGHAPSTGGKRRVLLRVVPDAYSSVGLHLDPESITGVLLDLAGGVRLRSRRRVPQDASPATVAAALTRTLKQLVRRSGIDESRVLGVGLAVPGPLDADHRRVLGPPNLPGWDDVALADLVEQRAGMPVVMDNDATAAAIGERWAAGKARRGSFVYVYLGAGVGVGVVLGDQVHRGTSNNAGEIGHVNGGGAGRPCSCGKRGCLEAYCSMRAIVDEWLSATGSPEGDSVSADYEEICRAAAGGDATAVRLLRQAATKLGQALATVVSVLDVDHVVLGGPALRHVEELVRSRVEKTLAAHVWAPAVRPVRVRTALIGEDAGAVGAASLVLDHAYSPRLATLLGS
ncbi:putative NBD/HSP70 family sugar kinase [Saccharopolyspora erythraea NRRL 2338]|uniref:Transcriptional regulator, ROK family n=2 Tax=Saccharopolyspora erythraea TaxID=1836 RepID=A4FQW3_SACEN|nr:ROK family transcriptional regulator [Saccharopolyspora erythraea]EQD85738.1 ROK family transcriptional regulator [Saccharopolyspora erythraea D]PFG93040.1 putative NBD/HSP70 family sugar kinase [Saccharopolyspora erythraea NRRL 2338]QRK89922.1 ROK family transcriptional regulator [Saccharopolyspora erythraea]CAM06438.1 transcriptional regulator, ROK family [Saccharopolyspora erythraea NRRL 2338]